MSTSNVGIHAIGFSLPDTIRTNDWWPKDAVESWRARRFAAPAIDTSTFTENMKMALAELTAIQAVDPFLGARERRIVKPGERSVDFELKAAEEAIEKAGIDRSEIDLLLVNSLLPGDLNAPNTCLLHKMLGLKPRCFSAQTQNACNAFLLQLTLAEKMIASGQAKYALLVHSCIMSPLLVPEMSLSCVFGDGAAAVVVGPVSEGRGILGSSHHTDGDFYDVIKIGKKDGTWYDEGRNYLFSGDGRAGFRMMVELADHAKTTIHEALEEAGCTPEDVDFVAIHQGAKFIPEVCLKGAGLTNARTLDTFSWTANLSSANIPVILATALSEGLLHDDDLVAMHAGGSGITLSGTVMRWGR